MEALTWRFAGTPIACRLSLIDLANCLWERVARFSLRLPTPRTAGAVSRVGDAVMAQAQSMAWCFAVLSVGPAVGQGGFGFCRHN